MCFLSETRHDLRNLGCRPELPTHHSTSWCFRPDAVVGVSAVRARKACQPFYDTSKTPMVRRRSTGGRLASSRRHSGSAGPSVLRRRSERP